MDTSTSTDSNANTDTDNQESSTNTITEYRADLSLDTKAGGDIKTCVDPPATITGTSQTEPVLGDKKSDSPDHDNFCKEKTTRGGEEKKMEETSKSTNSNAHTDTDKQELMTSTVAEDQANSNLDTKAGSDTKVCVDPSAINTATSETEPVLNDTKCDSPHHDNLCKEKATGGGYNTSFRSISPSAPKSDMCDSPDFNLFNKTINFLSIPHSITGTSTPATDSSEMLEEDMVLKWDDDDEEENDKFEEGKSAEQEPNLNSNMEGNEITVIEKQIEKSSDLESKVDDESTDESVKKISPTEKKKPEELLTEKNDGVTVNQENKEEPKNASVENLITNLEKMSDDESVSKQNNNPTYDIETDKNEMKLTDSIKTATITKEILKDVNFENEEIEDDGETKEDKDTSSIDNIITNLDQMIDVDGPVNKENVNSSLSTKTDQMQINLSDSAELKLSTGKLIPATENEENTEDTQMEIDKVTTFVSNVNTNPEQMMESEQKEDSSLDTKRDKEQVGLKVKSSSEESFMDTENESESKNCIQTSIEQITSCVDNTNLKQMIDINEDNPINVDKTDTAIQKIPDLNLLKNKMDTDNCNETVTENQIVEISDTKIIEKSLDLGAPSEVQKILSPTKKEYSSEEVSKIDSHDIEISDVIKEKCADIIFPAKSMSVSGNSSELDIATSNSFLDATLEEKEHNLIKPNMMTEIPSQSMIDFDDSLNLTHNESTDAKYQDDSVQKPKEQIAEIGDSQKKDDVSEESSNKSEISKTDSEINDTKIQDLNENEDIHWKQTSADKKTELSATIKETDLDKIETEVTKQIDSDKLATESSAKINESSVEIQDKIEPTVDPITPLKTTGTTDQTNDQTFQEDTNLVEPKASSSEMDPDTSDEVPEVTDSLGLLAESFRVMEDDEEQETSDHDEGDDEEDFDQDDESSNQMTTEQDSNDSNTAQQSETDIPKDAPITQADVQTEIDIDTDDAQDFTGKIEGIDDVTEMEMEDIQSESNVDTEVTDKDGDVDIEEDMVIDEVDIAATTAVEANLPDQCMADLESAIVEAAEDLEKVDREPEKQGATDIETVKLSDSSDLEEDAPKNQSTTILKTLLETSKADPLTPEKSSPAKTKKLEISKQKPPLNFVDLEESSSEDVPPADVQEVSKEPGDDVTSVNIPNEIEIMSVGGNTSDIVTKEKEVVISGVPKPPPVKPARLNTSEVTIKSTTANEPTTSLVVPEVKGEKAKFGLEVFSLDSDEEEPAPAKAPTPPPEPAPSEPEPKPQDRRNKCINDACPSDSSATYGPAPRAARAMYAPHHTKKAQICERCAQAVVDRSKSLVSDIRSFTPLLQMDMGNHRQELVEISDSDSEGEGETEEEEKVAIGWTGAAMLDHLTKMINESWHKFRMDTRLKEAENALKLEQEFQENELKELGAILDGCQIATDKLRNDLYATFEPQKKELPALIVFDTPDNMYSFVVPPQLDSEKNTSGQHKRRLSSVVDTPNKKIAIPLGFSGNDAKTDTVPEPKTPLSTPQPALPDDKNDDDKDISVVKLSAESAPASLPPPGEPSRPRVHTGMQVYAMRNAFGSWLRAKVVECTLKGTAPAAAQFSQCRVKFESKTHKNAFKTLSARCLAYSEPSEVRMTIGTRIIALFKEKDKEEQPKRESYYSGIVAEVPNPVNNFRYLVFFDDGYAQYVQHADTRLVCEFSSLVWEEVHPFSREFVRQYLLAYPERPMVRLHPGQSLKTEWNGKWWSCKVIQVDASLVHVHFEKDNRTEWIYRGSTRLAPLYLELQAAERHRARPLPRNRLANQVKSNMPYVEYTRSEEQTAAAAPEKPVSIHTQVQAQEELRRQRAVAKKSTAAAPPPPAASPQVAEAVTSRVVYYTPKNAVKPYKMTTHTCSPKCKRSDVLSLKELRTYNPLAKPLLSGWERQIVRFKGHKEVMYRAPCGRRIREMKELHRYLRTTKSEMSVDLFDFASTTHCLAEFVLNRCIVSKKDLSNGKENVPVPCVNYYDDSLPEFCSYNTERTPTEGVPLNLDPDFLCGCDCTDDCEDKSKCACWKLTLEGARTIGLDGDVGYEYRRLPEPLPSGIYECNSKCKCKQTCLNRVAQHPLQLKLQVFKTINRGWGIRALNDVPKGAFLCVYAGNLLTDATANLDGLNEGDEYLAELDYIEVVEQMKEGYEEDIPEADKKLDKESGQTSSSEEESSSDDEQSRSEQNDGDFEPGDIGLGLQDFSKRLRKRDRRNKKDSTAPPASKGGAGGGGEGGEECITISDDEELREPARFAARPGMGAEFVPKYRSVRTLFGKDEACYIMDAKVQGNIGRYLNHSCSPNVFVQNVFVDTHDPRFPWVAFFALRAVRAGTELTWNYNYDVGSVPGKVLYCHCGAANCRGRLL